MKVMNGIIKTGGRREKYANIYPQKNGIRIIFSDEINKEGITRVVRYNGNVYIQERLYLTYGIHNNAEIVQERPGVIFIKGCKKVKVIPEKLVDGIIQDTENLPKISKDKKEKVKNLHNGKICLNKMFAKKTVVVELHRGKHSYIDIKVAKDTKILESVPHISVLQSEYGKCLTDLTDDAVCFWIDLPGSTYNIPAEWLRSQGFDYNGEARFIQLNNTHVIVVPMTKICEYDGMVIDPLYEKPTNGHLCEECQSYDKEKEKEDPLVLMKRIEKKMDLILAFQTSLA